MNYILPESFDQIIDTLKDKIKKAYGITDVQYSGSNVSILSQIFSYLAHIINTNQNFGINECIISKAQNKKNILLLAKELGYEPRRKTSFKYRIKLKSKTSGIVVMPKFTKFKNGDKNYVYLGEDIEYKFGTDCSRLDITNQELFNNLYQRKGDVPGSLIVSDDDEILEVIDKTSMQGGEKLLLNNISGSGEPVALYSKKATSLYKRNDETGEMIRLADIETFIIDETDPDNPIFTIQLKNLEPTEIPTEKTELLDLKFFTDDCEYHKLTSDFEGFIAVDYNYESEVIKFTIKSNYVIIDGKQKFINELITSFRLKRLAVAPEYYDEGMFDKEQQICIIKQVEEVKTCNLEITEGKLLTYDDDPALKVVIDSDHELNKFVSLDYQNIEQDGVFLEISRVNYKGELVIKEPWTRRDYYIAEKPFKGEDTTFVVLNNHFYDREYLDIYTQYAATGTPFYSGDIFYFKLLQSSGANGGIDNKSLFTVESEDIAEIFEVIPQYESTDNVNDIINAILVQSGSDEESVESIRMNAPLYNNLAQRLVTKRDYQTYCNLFQFVEQTEVWGGEELEDEPKLGNVFFTFIPKSRPVEYFSDENKTTFMLKNADNRDLFFLPESQILMEEDGGNSNSIFEELSKKKIITLQYQYVPPKYLDFIIEIKIIKYLIGKSNIETRQEVFNAVRDYFDKIESFNSEIFESNLVKYVDRKLNDDSGIELKTFLESTIYKDDFIETGKAAVETSKSNYTCQILFEFPVEGVFENNVYSHTGEVTEYGKAIKDRLPGIRNNGAFEQGAILEFDFEAVKYYKVVDGITEEIYGPFEDIDASAISFHIPLYLDTTNIDMLSSLPKERRQIGWLQVFNKSRMIYIQIDTTDSDDPTDLDKRGRMSLFDVKRNISIENNANMILKRNTFPRLKRVDIVEEIQ